MTEARHFRAQVAGLRSKRPNDHARILAARQALKTANAASYLEVVLAEAPDLRPEQVERLVGILQAARTAPE